MSEWVSVDDRFPEDDRLKVVMYCREDSGRHIGIALSHYTESLATGKHDFEFNRGTQPTRVTHWISLPKMPK